jgi:ADP-heptose:LPS heptosyltransferase
MIGNDTGFTHFASLVLPKVIIISGGGSFKRFFPWPGDNQQYIIYYGLPCFDCDFECLYPQKLCINLIKPRDLLEYFVEVMGKKQAQKEKRLNTDDCQYKLGWRRRPGEEFYADC